MPLQEYGKNSKIKIKFLQLALSQGKILHIKLTDLCSFVSLCPFLSPGAPEDRHIFHFQILIYWIKLGIGYSKYRIPCATKLFPIK